MGQPMLAETDESDGELAHGFDCDRTRADWPCTSGTNVPGAPWADAGRRLMSLKKAGAPS